MYNTLVISHYFIIGECLMPNFQVGFIRVVIVGTGGEGGRGGGGEGGMNFQKLSHLGGRGTTFFARKGA